MQFPNNCLLQVLSRSTLRYKKLWVLEQKRRRGMDRDWRRAALRKNSKSEKQEDKKNFGAWANGH